MSEGAHQFSPLPLPAATDYSKNASSRFTPLPSFGIPSSNPWSNLPSSTEDIWGATSTSTTNSLTTQASSVDARTNSVSWSLPNKNEMSRALSLHSPPVSNENQNPLTNSLQSSLSIDTQERNHFVETQDRSPTFRSNAVNVPRSTSLSIDSHDRNQFLDAQTQDRSPMFRNTACNIPASMLPQPQQQPQQQVPHQHQAPQRVHSPPYVQSPEQHQHQSPPYTHQMDRQFSAHSHFSQGQHSYHSTPSQNLNDIDFSRQLSHQSVDRNPNPTNQMNAASQPYIPQAHQHQQHAQHHQPQPQQHAPQQHQQHPAPHHAQHQQQHQALKTPKSTIFSLQNPNFSSSPTYVRFQEPNHFANPHARSTADVIEDRGCELVNDVQTPSTCESGNKMNANSDAFIPKAERSLCRYFQKGHCVYGAKCWYRHGGPPDAAVAAPNIMAHQPQPQNEQEKIECQICYESVLLKGERFGMLDGCDHAFCLSCVRNWRKAEGQERTNLRRCPLCRNESYFVVPCHTWPTPEEKVEIIAEFKKGLKSKKCKYFDSEEGLDSCPFGSSCFYAHLAKDGSEYKPPSARWAMGSDGSKVVGKVTLADFLNL